MKTNTAVLGQKNIHTLLDQPVVVLYNKTDEYIKGESQDRIADEGVIYCAKSIISVLQSEGLEVIDLPYDRDIELVLADYPPNEYILFNLGEGLAGKILEESRIAWALEIMGYAFTGNSGDAIAKSTNKAFTKALLQATGLDTPEWWVFTHKDEVMRDKHSSITFPLIVKPIAEDGSIGLNESAVVHNLDELRDRVGYILEKYHQSALAERFIDGRELNVALLGNPPEVLPIAEIDFSEICNPFERIVSFDAKWKEDSFEYNNTPSICPANLPPALVSKIQNMAVKTWNVLGCSGYARVDIRLDKCNVPYIVEVNCNPDISPNAGFHVAATAAGYSYKKLITHILNNAWRRSNAYRQYAPKSTRTLYHQNIRESESIQQS